MPHFHYVNLVHFVQLVHFVHFARVVRLPSLIQEFIGSIGVRRYSGTHFVEYFRFQLIDFRSQVVDEFFQSWVK